MWAFICKRARRHWAVVVAAASAIFAIAPQLVLGLQGLPWREVVGDATATKIMFGLLAAGVFFSAIQASNKSDEGF